jgi:large subunit ribosomal protein L20
MTRVKRGFIARKRRKKILRLTNGFRGSHSTLFRTGNQQAMKAAKYATKGRINRKRDIRRLWIKRISNYSRTHGRTYHWFISELKQVPIQLNRRTLSQLAILDPGTMKGIWSLLKDS